LALIYGAVFLVFGIQGPFLPVWLGARGVPVGQIALALACPKLLQMIAVPALTRWADRRGGVVAMLALSSVAMTGLFAALATPAPPTTTLLAVGLLFLAQSGAAPLIDVLALALIAQAASARREGAAQPQGRAPFDYGRVRKWGSAAFIVGNLLAGAFLSLTSLTAVTLLLAIASAVATLVTMSAWRLDRLVHPSNRPVGAPLSPGGSRLLLVVIGAAASIQASHAMVLSFASTHWAQSGHSDAFIGAAWAVGVAVETLVFALFGRWFAGADQAAALMVVGGLTATLRWTVMAFDPGDVVLMIAQASHGLTFAATHAGTMLLISDLAPADRRARAQGWATVGISGLTAALTAACGPLVLRFGESSYIGMAAFSLVGALVAMSVPALRARRRQHPETLPRELGESARR
jgi:PPP family 3-phenylpropionic acid transporter